jgi:hypothetical protein
LLLVRNQVLMTDLFCPPPLPPKKSGRVLIESLCLSDGSSRVPLNASPTPGEEAQAGGPSGDAEPAGPQSHAAACPNGRRYRALPRFYSRAERANSWYVGRSPRHY